MVIAILSFVFSCVSLLAFWWLSIPGVILGIIAIAKAGDNNVQKAFGIAGTIVGAIALVVVIAAVALASIGSSIM